MGDLGVDTAVEPLGDGHFRAVLSQDWEIWGPNGGYVAAVALRAVGAACDHPRPATFACHYLGVAKFDAVDIRVETRKPGRTAASHRVEMTQDGRPILDASVWSVAGAMEGLEHDETSPPDVPGPDDLAEISELLPPDAESPYGFWRNLVSKPVHFEKDWPPDGPREAVWREWLRFTPTATFEDPWLDAARSVILVDVASWPSAHRPHAWTEHPFIAPTLDLSVSFHRPTVTEEWLLCDGTAPVSTQGLFGWTARVWSAAGRLHASGGGQCLYRKMPAR